MSENKVEGKVEEVVVTNPVVTEPVAPVVAEEKPPQGSTVKDLLYGAVKSVRTEIERCDEEIERWEARKEELQQQLNEALEGLMPKPKTAKPATSRPGRKRPGEVSIHDLILAYMEEHKKATTSEIREHLVQQGRSTNPGVELSRMVKQGTIENVNRGVYELVAK